MKHEQLIQATEKFAKKHLSGAEGGHDWQHTQRVTRMALYIAEHEPKANKLIVEIAALVHDISDPKFTDGDESIAPKLIEEHLNRHGQSAKFIHHIISIVKYSGFKSNLSTRPFNSIELEIVQDADRLDAIGAIGIARAFNYGGHKGNLIHSPNAQPRISLTKKDYLKSGGTTINHFHEKLLKLRDLMNTATAKKIAQQRHDYMLEFLDQFSKEWNLKELTKSI